MSIGFYSANFPSISMGVVTWYGNVLIFDCVKELKSFGGKHSNFINDDRNIVRADLYGCRLVDFDNIKLSWQSEFGLLSRSRANISFGFESKTT